MNKSTAVSKTPAYKLSRWASSMEETLDNAWKQWSIMTATFKMRRVIPKDNSYVKELIQKILIERGGVGSEALYYDKELLNIADYYGLPGHRFNVLLHKKQIVGTVGIGPSTHESFDPKKTCEVKKLYLRKEYRSQGQGKTMFRHALAQAKHMGYAQCVIKIEKREEQFLYFLLKEGFEQVIERDDDNFNYDLVMFKPLD